MSALSTFAIAVLVAAGIAAPASAASFTPKNTNFYATGPVTITNQQGVAVNCTLTSEGVTTGRGEVEFINASLTGESDDCFTNSFSSTPYYVTARGGQRGNILWSAPHF